MTTPDQLRDIVAYLQQRVVPVAKDRREVEFRHPTADEMAGAGLDPATVQRLLAAPWWGEMVDDVVETPAFAEPDASPEVVLGYARDVIRETIAKLFPLEN